MRIINYLLLSAEEQRVKQLFRAEIEDWIRTDRQRRLNAFLLAIGQIVVAVGLLKLLG